MKGVKAGLECGELIVTGFNQEQGLCRGFDCFLPPVNGLDCGNQGDAGSQALLDQCAGEKAAFVGGGSGG